MDNLPWNGTDLGDITPIWVNTVSSQHHSGVYLYMRPNIVCLAFKFTSSIPLIIDELKPLFGLPKLGRHRCTLNDQALLLQRILDYSEGPRKPEVQNVTLFEKRQIQRYHAFRHLVCLPFSKQREFWFRPSEGYLSYYEVTTKVNEVFPNPALLNIWFPEGSFNSVIKNLVEISPSFKGESGKKKDLNDCVERIRVESKEIIERIDGQHVGLSLQIHRRLCDGIYD